MVPDVCVSVEFRGARKWGPIFMGDEFHLLREDRLGLAALTHSREPELCPVCEKPQGQRFHCNPTPWGSSLSEITLVAKKTGWRSADAAEG